MIDAVSYASEHLTRYGGHPFAAGMSLDSSKIDDFRKAVNEFAAKCETADGFSRNAQIINDFTKSHFTP